MEIPFVGPAYRARSMNLNAQRCVNFYLEAGGPNGRSGAALIGTPGLVRKLVLPNAPCEVRAAEVFKGELWVVGGSKLYSITPGWVATERGTLGTSDGFVSIQANSSQLMIVDGVSGYIWDNKESEFSQITDPEFPAGAKTVSYLDNYFIAETPDTEQFSISALGDGLNWNGADFTSAEGAPDNIVTHLTDHRQLWVLGDSTIQIFENTGNADFPLEASGTAFIEVGCAAAASAARFDNSVVWLGKDENGQGIVWRAANYNPTRMSDHGLEFAMQSYPRIDDARAFTYQQDGHTFYVLTFPTADATWHFDAATGTWAERAWLDTSSGKLHRHRANCHAAFNGQNIVGDWENGILYALDLNAFTDDGSTILSLRAAPTLANEQRYLFFSALQVDIEAGVGTPTGQGQMPKMMLRYSDDGGHTWSNRREATMGKIGQYGARAKWNRLGRGRNRVFEVSVTDPVKRVILGAFADVEKGAS